MFYAIFECDRVALIAALGTIDERVQIGEDSGWPVNAGRFETDDSRRVAAVDVALALPNGWATRLPGSLRECLPVAFTATGSGATEVTVWEHPSPTDEDPAGFLVFVGTALAFQAAVLDVGEDWRTQVPHSEPAHTLTAALVAGAKPVAVWSDRLPALRGGEDAAFRAYEAAAEGRLAFAHKAKWAESQVRETNPDALLVPGRVRVIARRRRLAAMIADERTDRCAYPRLGRPRSWVQHVIQREDHGKYLARLKTKVEAELEALNAE